VSNSIWTIYVKPETVELANKLADEVGTDFGKIFTDMETIQPEAINVSQEVLDALERHDLESLVKTQKAAVVVMDKLLVIILAYEKWLQNNQDCPDSNRIYVHAVSLWNLVHDLHGHLERCIVNIKIGI